jgi:hypothetical protein
MYRVTGTAIRCRCRPAVFAVPVGAVVPVVGGLPIGLAKHSYEYWSTIADRVSIRSGPPHRQDAVLILAGATRPFGDSTGA